jgi:hypothetical protein
VQARSSAQAAAVASAIGIGQSAAAGKAAKAASVVSAVASDRAAARAANAAKAAAEALAAEQAAASQVRQSDALGAQAMLCGVAEYVHHSSMTMSCDILDNVLATCMGVAQMQLMKQAAGMSGAVQCRVYLVAQHTSKHMTLLLATGHAFCSLLCSPLCGHPGP